MRSEKYGIFSLINEAFIKVIIKGVWEVWEGMFPVKFACENEGRGLMAGTKSWVLNIPNSQNTVRFRWRN